MNLFDLFLGKSEQKPLILQDLTDCELFKISIKKKKDDGEILDVIEMIVADASPESAATKIRRIIAAERRGATVTEWTTRRLEIDADSEKIAEVSR